MGASTFMTTAFGKTVEEAFAEAAEDAKFRHGQAGYTGTIAEKSNCTVIPAAEHKRKQKRKYARDLLAEDDERIVSKWGPAGAISLSGTNEAKRYRKNHDLQGKHGDVWLFFGWASR